MADLLGSILGQMQTPPPSLSSEQRKKVKEQQRQMERLQEMEKAKLQKYKSQVQKVVQKFIKDGEAQSHKFEPVEKVYRAIAHEVAEVAGLTSFSFGEEPTGRYVMLWKKEFAPADEELAAYRKGETWDPQKAKEAARLKVAEEAASAVSPEHKNNGEPHSNYRDKYQHLIGTTAAKEAAMATTANKSYGFVPSENKRDLRSIEQVLHDNRAKRLKTEHPSAQSEDTDAPDKLACGASALIAKDTSSTSDKSSGTCAPISGSSSSTSAPSAGSLEGNVH